LVGRNEGKQPSQKKSNIGSSSQIATDHGVDKSLVAGPVVPLAVSRSDNKRYSYSWPKSGFNTWLSESLRLYLKSRKVPDEQPPK